MLASLGYTMHEQAILSAWVLLCVLMCFVVLANSRQGRVVFVLVTILAIVLILAMLSKKSQISGSFY